MAGAASATDACLAYLPAYVEARSDAGTAMTRVRICGRSRTESPPSEAMAASISALVLPALNLTRMSSRPLALPGIGLCVALTLGGGVTGAPGPGLAVGAAGDAAVIDEGATVGANAAAIGAAGAMSCRTSARRTIPASRLRLDTRAECTPCDANAPTWLDPNPLTPRCGLRKRHGPEIRKTEPDPNEERKRWGLAGPLPPWQTSG